MTASNIMKHYEEYAVPSTLELFSWGFLLGAVIGIVASIIGLL